MYIFGKEVLVKLTARYLYAFLLLALFVLIPPVMAKGPVDKITIEGPGLKKPIEITDPDTMSRLIRGVVNSLAPEAH